LDRLNKRFHNHTFRGWFYWADTTWCRLNDWTSSAEIFETRSKIKIATWIISSSGLTTSMLISTMTVCRNCPFLAYQMVDRPRFFKQLFRPRRDRNQKRGSRFEMLIEPSQRRFLTAFRDWVRFSLQRRYCLRLTLTLI